MLPYLTHAVPGIGGVLRAAPEDFRVDEVPAYAACGEGNHVFVRIQKRGLTTAAAIKRISSELRIAERDIGVAGQKDRHALTTQWISLPPPATPENALRLGWDDLTVLDAQRHVNKLRTGHLRANRFVIRIREITGAAENGQRALAELARAPGVPNFYGEQRFGRFGDNAAQGRRLLERGDKRAPNARFLISALQSHVFNDWLVRRMADGLWDRVVSGDILHKVGGGLFDSVAPDIDTPRLHDGEVTITGPMVGHAMRAPAPESAAARAEAALFTDHGVAPGAFRAFGKLAEGTRRDAAVLLQNASFQQEGNDVVVSFDLPSGAYATVVLRELMKNDSATDAEASSAAASDEA